MLLTKNSKNIKFLLKAIIEMLGGGDKFLSFLFNNGLINKSKLAVLKNETFNGIEAVADKASNLINPNQILKGITKSFGGTKTTLSVPARIKNNPILKGTLSVKTKNKLNILYDDYTQKITKIMTNPNLSMTEKKKLIKPTTEQAQALKASTLSKSGESINFTQTGQSDKVLGRCSFILNNPTNGTGTLTLQFLKKRSGVWGNPSTPYTYKSIPLVVWQAMASVTELRPNLKGGPQEWGAMHLFWDLYLYGYYQTNKGKKANKARIEKAKITMEVKKETKSEGVDYSKIGKMFINFAKFYGEEYIKGE